MAAEEAEEPVADRLVIKPARLVACNLVKPLRRGTNINGAQTLRNHRSWLTSSDFNRQLRPNHGYRFDLQTGVRNGMSVCERKSLAPFQSQSSNRRTKAPAVTQVPKRKML